MRLIQLKNKNGRSIGLVEEPNIVILNKFNSIYDLARDFLQRNPTHQFTEAVDSLRSPEKVSYDEVYQPNKEWQILPAFDHPEDVNGCHLSGTGLTHKASAENRQKMHDSQKEGSLSDSMKMYLSGLEGGKPDPGVIGVQPEWFYKGNGSQLRGHGDSLEIPNYGKDGGEEPEIAGVYLNDSAGNPRRIGFCTANEFSDHVMEKENYLYLAPSKIMQCAIGPELVISDDFSDVVGKVAIRRGDSVLWEKDIHTGEKNMAHHLSNLEYHHFKYANHRVPHQVNIHFFGADAFSFGEGIQLQEADQMIVHWEGFGRPLINSLKINREEAKPVNIDHFT